MRIFKMYPLVAAAIVALGPIGAHADEITFGQNVNGSQSASGNYSYIDFAFNGNKTTGVGGDFTGSTAVIGGNNVAFTALYSIDPFSDVGPGSFPASVTQNAVINGATFFSPPAAQVAWLMDNIAPTAKTPAQDLALQAAIWQVEYGGGFVLEASTDPTVQGIFESDLALLGTNTAPVDTVYWISPVNSGSSDREAVVGTVAVTPEPSSVVLFGSGLLCMVWVLRKRLSF